MKISELDRGCQVTLQVSYSDTTHEFESHVMGQMNGVMILSGAAIGNRRLRLPSDGGINIIFQTLNQLYIWKKVVVETLQYKEKVFYRIKKTDIDSRPYNRRGAYRLSINLDMPIAVYSNGVPEEKQVIVKDISETGMCFLSKEDIALQKKVHMYYETEDGVYDMTGYIVRKIFDTESFRYIYGCCMDEYNKELGGFIMKEQMKRRRITA